MAVHGNVNGPFKSKYLMKISFKILLLSSIFIQQSFYTMNLQPVQYTSPGCFDSWIFYFTGIRKSTVTPNTLVIKTPEESLISYEDVKFVLNVLSEFKYSPDILANLAEAYQPQYFTDEDEAQRTLQSFISMFKEKNPSLSKSSITFILANAIIPKSFLWSAKLRTEAQLYERFSKQGQLFIIKQSPLGEA